MSGALTRIICPVCKREVAGYPPAGGDGTALRPRRHKVDDKWCSGRHAIVTDWRTSC